MSSHWTSSTSSMEIPRPWRRHALSEKWSKSQEAILEFKDRWFKLKQIARLETGLVKFSGRLEGITINEEDIEEAKRSLFKPLGE